LGQGKIAVRIGGGDDAVAQAPDKPACGVVPQKGLIRLDAEVLQRVRQRRESVAEGLSRGERLDGRTLRAARELLNQIGPAPPLLGRETRELPLLARVLASGGGDQQTERRFEVAPD